MGRDQHHHRRDSGGSNGSVPRSIPDVESSVVNKVDPLGQTWRKSRPIGNGRLPIGRYQPRSQKAGHHPEGIPRPISERNLTFAYELEAWRMAGCRHGQQQALSRWRGSKRIRVPIDCLQRSLGHGRMSRALSDPLPETALEFFRPRNVSAVATLRTHGTELIARVLAWQVPQTKGQLKVLVVGP